MRTRGQYYESPTLSPEVSEAEEEANVEVLEANVEERVARLPCWGPSAFEDMADDYELGGPSVRDRYSGRSGGIAFVEWKVRFKSWVRTQRQKNLSFNDWWAFERLPSHLEHEALQAYDAWSENHAAFLLEVEAYWERRLEMVTVLKEAATFGARAVAQGIVQEEEDDAGTGGPAASRARTTRGPTA